VKPFFGEKELLLDAAPVVIKAQQHVIGVPPDTRAREICSNGMNKAENIHCRLLQAILRASNPRSRKVVMTTKGYKWKGHP